MAVKETIEGRTLEEAIAAAASRLRQAPEDLHYRLIDEGRRGLLGVGARNVRIEIEIPEGVAPPAAVPEPRPVPPPPAPTPEPEEPPEPAVDAAVPEAAEVARVTAAVERIVALAGFELEVRARAVPGGVDLELDGPDRKLVTQRGGELAQAVQFLLNRMGRRAWPEIGRVEVAGSHGRGSRRDDELVEEIREIAGQVARTGKPKRMQPMNPYERRLVHVTVREFAGLETHSEGDGFLKAVTIRRAGS